MNNSSLLTGALVQRPVMEPNQPNIVPGRSLSTPSVKDVSNQAVGFQDNKFPSQILIVNTKNQITLNTSPNVSSESDEANQNALATLAANSLNRNYVIPNNNNQQQQQQRIFNNFVSIQNESISIAGTNGNINNPNNNGFVNPPNHNNIMIYTNSNNNNSSIVSNGSTGVNTHNVNKDNSNIINKNEQNTNITNKSIPATTKNSQKVKVAPQPNKPHKTNTNKKNNNNITNASDNSALPPPAALPPVFDMKPPNPVYFNDKNFGTYGMRCVCGDSHTDDTFLIQCEKCDMWLHGSCVNIFKFARSGSKIGKDDGEPFFCPFCAKTKIVCKCGKSMKYDEPLIQCSRCKYYSHKSCEDIDFGIIPENFICSLCFKKISASAPNSKNWYDIPFTRFPDDFDGSLKNGDLINGGLNTEGLNKGELNNDGLSKGELNNEGLNKGELNNEGVNKGELNTDGLNKGELNNEGLNKGELNNGDGVEKCSEKINDFNVFGDQINKESVLQPIPEGKFKEMVEEDLGKGELSFREMMERYFQKYAPLLFEGRTHEFFKVFVETFCAIFGCERNFVLNAIDTLAICLLYYRKKENKKCKEKNIKSVSSSKNEKGSINESFPDSKNRKVKTEENNKNTNSLVDVFDHSESITNYLDTSQISRLEKQPNVVKLYVGEDGRVYSPVSLEDNAYIVNVPGYLLHTEEVKADNGIPNGFMMVTNDQVIIDTHGTSFHNIAKHIRRSFHFNTIVKLIRLKGELQVALFATRMKGPLGDEKIRRGDAVQENGEIILPFDSSIPFLTRKVEWKEKRRRRKSLHGQNQNSQNPDNSALSNNSGTNSGQNATKGEIKKGRKKITQQIVARRCLVQSGLTLLSSFLDDAVPPMPFIVLSDEEEIDVYKMHMERIKTRYLSQ